MARLFYLRRHAEHAAWILVFQQPKRAIRGDFYIPGCGDLLSTIVRQAWPVALTIKGDAQDRLACHPTDQRRPIPLREQLAVIKREIAREER